MKDQADSRLIYMTAKKGLIEGGCTQESIDRAILAQSFLRFEQPLTTTSTLFNFPVLTNASNNGQAQRATEKRLKLQDALFCSELAVFITKASSSSATNLLLNTFPNPVTYPTGSAALQSFYNGQLRVTVNNDVLIPGMDLQRFQIVPETQLTGATNSPVDEFYGDGELSAFTVIQPNLTFIGQKDTQVVIELPGNISALDANVYAVIIARGILAQNVTVVS
ncbi:MAG: hypothetical protein ABW007_02105 [Chitinophagaceae bacterium]